jgi:hypothetical protein
MNRDGDLRPLIRRNVLGCHWQAIESGGTGLGIPDLNGKFRDGPEIWIECKMTRGWAVTLRPEQIGWLVTRARYGGHVFVAVRRRPEKGGADELYLCRGSYARELRAEGLRAAYVGRGLVGRWEGGPGSGGWNWEVVAASLRAGSLTPPARGAP